MESSARTKKPTTGMRKSGDLARNETRRGAKQRRKAGSTSAFGWLRTKRHAPSRGTRLRPTTSIRRKKTRSAKSSTTLMTRLSKFYGSPAPENEKPGAGRPRGAPAPGTIVLNLGRLLSAHDAAHVRAEPVAAGVVRERQQQQDEQPEEHRRDDDPDEPRAVADVHEEEQHEHHLRHRDGHRDHVVHPAEVDVRREDRDRRPHQQRREDREVSRLGYDVFRHGFPCKTPSVLVARREVRAQEVEQREEE